MIFKNIRDGAKLEVTNDGFANFRGVAASTFLNPNRVTSLMPPSADVTLLPGILYKVFTGLSVSRNALYKFGTPDVRAVAEVYKKTGLRVERVDVDGVMKDGELVVYVTVQADLPLNKNETLFESFGIGQASPKIAIGEEMVAVGGFVPVATKTVQEPSKRPAANPTGPAEMTEAQRQAQFDKWLNEGGGQAPKETITPNNAQAPVNHTLPTVDGVQLRPAEVRPATPTGE